MAEPRNACPSHALVRRDREQAELALAAEPAGVAAVASSAGMSDQANNVSVTSVIFMGRLGLEVSASRARDAPRGARRRPARSYTAPVPLSPARYHDGGAGTIRSGSPVTDDLAVVPSSEPDPGPARVYTPP